MGLFAGLNASADAPIVGTRLARRTANIERPGSIRAVSSFHRARGRRREARLCGRLASAQWLALGTLVFITCSPLACKHRPTPPSPRPCRRASSRCLASSPCRRCRCTRPAGITCIRLAGRSFPLQPFRPPNLAEYRTKYNYDGLSAAHFDSSLLGGGVSSAPRMIGSGDRTATRRY
jgi:hypothetical protein